MNRNEQSDFDHNFLNYSTNIIICSPASTDAATNAHTSDRRGAATAAIVATIMGVRWEVEILFKELKSRYALDMVPTSNPQVIGVMIWIAMLMLLISRKIYRVVQSLNPEAKMARFIILDGATSSPKMQALYWLASFVILD